MRVLKVARKKVNVEHVAFGPSAALIAVGAADVEVGPWDVHTGLPASPDAGADLRPGPAATFHPSGRWLFGTGRAFGLAVYDLDKRVTNRWAGEPGERAGYARFAPDGETMLYSWARPPLDGRGPGERRLVCQPWTAGARAEPTWTTHPYPDHPDRNGFLTGLALLPGGERFATADYAVGQFGSGARITIRSLRTGEVLAKQDVASTDYLDLAVSPDGAVLAVRKGPYLLVWRDCDLSAPETRAAYNGRKHFTDLAFHPSSRYLAATSNDTTVKLYDTTTWEVARTFTWELGRMRSVCFSADGTLAAAGSDTGHVVVWDVDL